MQTFRQGGGGGAGYPEPELGSLSNDVFERHMSTGSCPFSFLGDGFAQIFSQIVSIRVKKLSNTNYIASRHITREKSSLPVDVRRSKTSLLKLPVNKGVGGGLKKFFGPSSGLSLVVPDYPMGPFLSRAL